MFDSSHYWHTDNVKLPSAILFRPGLAALLLAAALSALSALAGERWGELHGEVEKGNIKPLASVLNVLEARFKGQVIEVELERDDGIAIYEIEMIGPQGQVVEFEVDAASGELIGIEGRNIRGMERR